MKIVNLYRYDQSNGVMITPTKRDDADTPHAYRVIADENKVLVKDGQTIGHCIDVAVVEGITEIDYIEEEKTVEDTAKDVVKDLSNTKDLFANKNHFKNIFKLAKNKGSE